MEDSDHQPQTRTRTRRSHTKSRNGCWRCKRRKIKCDEAKPECGNCVRFMIPCDYSPDNQGAQSTAPVRGRGRPRKDWSIVPVERNLNITTSISPSTSTLSLPGSLLAPSPDFSLTAPSHIPWTVEDFELFHHYVQVRLWQDQTPRLAFRHHSVLHLILAIAALHLARQDLNRSAGLVDRAETHIAIALRQTTQILTNLSEQNCAELYIATVLICTCTFAKQPGPRHLLIVAEGQEVAWWELFRGVRIVVETIGIARIMALIASEAGEGPSAPPVARTSTQQAEQEQTYIVFRTIEWETALSNLSSFVEGQAPGPRKDTYRNTVNMLKWCFQETFGTSADPKPAADAKFQVIMIWMYVLEDEYVDMLKEDEPVALVILAYFAVLLQTLESVWYLRGWAAHIVQGVSGILESSSPQPIHHARWIEWPMTQVRNGTSALCSWA
ncbi:hypothetical protein F4810DRAFT_700336 [Camillea tinctor]|nr:hypothetical protein F4810DRAFT_700336 [Camillea tinctor]